MKSLLLSLFIVPVLFLTGCCTDQVSCGTNVRFVTTNSPACSACNRCNTCSACSACGYDASYTYSGWY